MIAFIVTIVILVFVHELGHYLVARWAGVRIETFSIGFGPTLYSRLDLNGCRWRLALIPLGGFVRMAEGEQNPGSFEGKSIGARAAIVAAGPAANFLFAILALWVVIASDLGFGYIASSLITATAVTIQMFGVIWIALADLILGETGNVAGIIGVAQISDTVAELGDWSIFVKFLAVMSINLGIVNLLPIPVLDGGHLALMGVEAVRGRKLSERTQGIMGTIGICVILLLIGIGTFNDIRGLIG